MRILIYDYGKFSGDDLFIGKEYDCIPVEDGTVNQNRAWHSLVQEYWTSGCHSYEAKNFLHFRELIKLYLGAGTETYYSLVDDKGQPSEKLIVRYRIKSWARYSKKERKESIDRLIAEMHQAQVQTAKFYKILQGMEKNEKLLS